MQRSEARGTADAVGYRVQPPTVVMTYRTDGGHQRMCSVRIPADGGTAMDRLDAVMNIFRSRVASRSIGKDQVSSMLAKLSACLCGHAAGIYAQPLSMEQAQDCNKVCTCSSTRHYHVLRSHASATAGAPPPIKYVHAGSILAFRNMLYV